MFNLGRPPIKENNAELVYGNTNSKNTLLFNGGEIDFTDTSFPFHFTNYDEYVSNIVLTFTTLKSVDFKSLKGEINFHLFACKLINCKNIPVSNFDCIIIDVF